MLFPRLIGMIIAPIYRLYAATFRYNFIFEKPEQKSFILNNLAKSKGKNPMIFAFFHQEEYSLIGAFIDKSICALVSKSKDGEGMSAIAEGLGYNVVRGSSSRGAAGALIQAIRIVRQGHHFTIAVDGPRGPIYKAKPGASAISSKTNTPIVPLRTSVQKKWFLSRTWNNGVIPKPFSRIDVHFLDTKVYQTSEELENKLKSFPLQTY